MVYGLWHCQNSCKNHIRKSDVSQKIYNNQNKLTNLCRVSPSINVSKFRYHWRKNNAKMRDKINLYNRSKDRGVGFSTYDNGCSTFRCSYGSYGSSFLGFSGKFILVAFALKLLISILKQNDWFIIKWNWQQNILKKQTKTNCFKLSSTNV